MSRDYSLYIEDIKESCDRIIKYVAGLSREEFFSEQKTYDAVVRNLTVIGEAVKNLPDELRDELSEVEWTKIARFRDITVHRYWTLDETIIWDIVQNKVPELLANVSPDECADHETNAASKE